MTFAYAYARLPCSQSLGPRLGQAAADSVRCLRFTRAGVLWAGTPYGLFYFAKDPFQQMVAGRSIHKIEEARNGRLLLTTNLGFVEWDGSRVIEHPEKIG